MTCWILVPVKAPAESKSRLRGVLDDAGRLALVARMRAHVLGVAAEAEGAQVVVVGPDVPDLAASIRRIDDPGGGLNAALSEALAVAVREGVDRIAIVAADLPLLTAADAAALLTVEEDGIAIAPDGAGAGTNALSLPVARAHSFTFRYGAESFARHAAEAARLGLPWRAIRSPTLARDIDMPEDLAVLADVNR